MEDKIASVRNAAESAEVRLWQAVVYMAVKDALAFRPQIKYAHNKAKAEEKDEIKRRRRNGNKSLAGMYDRPNSSRKIVSRYKNYIDAYEYIVLESPAFEHVCGLAGFDHSFIRSAFIKKYNEKYQLKHNKDGKILCITKQR